MQKQANPTYLKAITIRDPSDIHTIKRGYQKGYDLNTPRYTTCSQGC